MALRNTIATLVWVATMDLGTTGLQPPNTHQGCRDAVVVAWQVFVTDDECKTREERDRVAWACEVGDGAGEDVDERVIPM